MPRANRHHIPGQIWHITHRCHRRELLFRFAKDRKCWIQWLFEAKKRYGLSILNYVVTSNHIHLLVVDGEDDIISKSLQLIAGRSAQEFNRRKGRTGAFWEDRYHATAIDNGDHLLRCLVYIDMNMVRAGVVDHPSQWKYGGYHEIQSPPQRYRLIDRDKLIALTGASDDRVLREAHRAWIEKAVEEGHGQYHHEWSEAVAVGSEAFVLRVKQAMGVSATGRKIKQREGMHLLREPESAYSAHLAGEKAALSIDNAVYYVETSV